MAWNAEKWAISLWIFSESREILGVPWGFTGQ
jgi:hypothetical protein